MIDIKSTKIAGVHVLKPLLRSDERGHFSRIFCVQELDSILGQRKIMQINSSFTHDKYTIRGLHMQHAEAAEMKFIKCLKGSVFDVAVDMRSDSETFLCWHSEVISEKNGLIMQLPEGCAHGFQVLEEKTELLYFHTAAYNPSLESGVKFDDPCIGIDWPFEPKNISIRDRSFLNLDKKFSGCKP